MPYGLILGLSSFVLMMSVGLFMLLKPRTLFRLFFQFAHNWLLRGQFGIYDPFSLSPNFMKWDPTSDQEPNAWFKAQFLVLRIMGLFLFLVGFVFFFILMDYIFPPA